MPMDKREKVPSAWGIGGLQMDFFIISVMTVQVIIALMHYFK